MVISLEQKNKIKQKEKKPKKAEKKR